MVSGPLTVGCYARAATATLLHADPLSDLRHLFHGRAGLAGRGRPHRALFALRHGMLATLEPVQR